MDSSLPIWLIWQFFACIAFWIWGIFCVYEKEGSSRIKRVEDGHSGTYLYVVLPCITGAVSFIIYLFTRKYSPDPWYAVFYPFLVWIGCSVASFLALVFGIACGIAETEKHIRRKKR